MHGTFLKTRLQSNRHDLAVLLIALISMIPGYAPAQEHMGRMSDTSGRPMKGKGHAMKDMPGMSGMPMSHAFSLNLPMNRNGSGTGWSPDASPMYGYMVHAAGWMFMFHGDIFPRY